MSKSTVTAEPQPDVMHAIVSALATIQESLKAALPKPIQQMSAEAFAAIELPRPPIPTFQNGMEIDLRGVPEPQLSTTLRQLGEIPSGKYIDGLFTVIRTEPGHNTEGRLDIKCDSSKTEQRMQYYSRVRNFSDMVDQMWREAQPSRPKAASAA